MNNTVRSLLSRLWDEWIHGGRVTIFCMIVVPKCKAERL